jgi:TatD DNase family protein
LLTDAHVHLASYPDPLQEVEVAKKRGMRLVSVGVSVGEAASNLLIRRQEPETVRWFVGIHPSETAAPGDADLEGLAGFWEAADGVGEIGLDPKYSEVSPGSTQMVIFRRQLDKADLLDKPVQVHSRGAEATCLEVLETYSLRAVLLHWFEGEEMIQRAVSIPHSFFSFGPAILYSKKLSRIARKCPEETVLTESDGPVSFGPLGGAKGPGLIPSVAVKLSELWGKSFDETTSRLAENAERYLG